MAKRKKMLAATKKKVDAVEAAVDRAGLGVGATVAEESQFRKLLRRFKISR